MPMKKILLALLIGFVLIVVVKVGKDLYAASNINSVVESSMEDLENHLQSNEKEEIKVQKANSQVGFIQFDAEVITEENIEKLEKEFGSEFLSEDIDLKNTNILLNLDNHRINLAEFDYKSISELNGEKAIAWNAFSDAIGGHHIAGILSFEYVDEPLILRIADMPVGEVLLEFNNLRYDE